MKINQISIFLENRKGRLYDVCSLLAVNSINMLALTIAETEEFGVLRIIVDKPEETLSLLKTNGFIAKETDVVVARIQDHPGGLADILKVINEADINIEYMHAFLGKKTPHAYMVFRFDDSDKAIAGLLEKNVTIIHKNQIIDM